MSDYRFDLPDVGEGLGEGEIVHWHVAEGDAVKADQVIVDVQTDKAVVEIPSPVAGTIKALGGAVGATVPVGAMLAIIAAETPRPAASSAPAAAAPAPSAPESAPPRRRGRVLASPATRKRALDLGVDLASISGSGARGQVTRADVERAAAAPQAPPEQAAAAAAPKPESAPETPPASAPRAAPQTAPGIEPEPASAAADRVEPLRGLRRQIAQTMQAAWREIPHILTFHEIDATQLVAARRALAAEFEPEGVRPSYLPIVMKACAAALRRYPRFNAALNMEAEEIVYRGRVNIGFATATADGLIVPVVHDVDRKSILALAREIAELAEAARARKIGVAQLRGGTFTVSNYGSYGGHFGTPIIRPPEVAILGVGAIRDTVAAVDGAPAVRPSLPLAVSADHRLNDGEHLGAFAGAIAGYLREPARLLGRI